jgi:hypothetical protein|tara:strand:- start:187 stop:480 length:294 start_codon:yes stop_codon:yes gene_type:complete
MKALIKLLEFIATHKLDFVITKSGKGMCCYKLKQVTTHKEAIETLASACEWQLKFFEPSYIATKNTMSSPKYYLGPIPEVKEKPSITLDEMKASFTS